MFNLSYFKKNLKGGDKMKKSIVLILALFLVVGGFSTSFAASSRTLNVQANVPATSGAMTVVVKKVDVATSTATTDSSGTMSMGDLTTSTADPNIYAAPYYYYVDVSVVDNTQTVWTLTHTRTSFTRSGGSETLDNNFNVTFKKVTATDGAGTSLSAVSYANSNNVAFSKTTFSSTPGSWMRIIYGLGGTAADNAGVTALTKASTVAGTYNGTVTITLTP